MLRGIGTLLVAAINITASTVKSSPWMDPTIVTAIGIPPAYFSGIAMPNRTSVETPSICPMVLKLRRNLSLITLG